MHNNAASYDVVLCSSGAKDAKIPKAVKWDKSQCLSFRVSSKDAGTLAW